MAGGGAREGGCGEGGLGMIQLHYIQAQLLWGELVPNRPGPVLVCGPEVGNPWLKGFLASSLLGQKLVGEGPSSVML